MELRSWGWQHFRINVYLEWMTLVPRCPTAVCKAFLSCPIWADLDSSFAWFCTVSLSPDVLWENELSYSFHKRSSCLHFFFSSILHNHHHQHLSPTTPLPRNPWGIMSSASLLKSPALFLLPSWAGSYMGSLDRSVCVTQILLASEQMLVEQTSKSRKTNHI